jgi:hypothetical protein
MVNSSITLIRIGGAVSAALLLLVLAGQVAPLRWTQAVPNPVVAATPIAVPVKSSAPPVAQPPPVSQVLRSGVLIVISKASQRMYVFKDGAPWASSPVSTGKRGKATPSGVFPILQKRVFHRSNLYSNAPMPYMQRLTWSGIAIHAGHLPGYPASHGCIRLPRAFAQSLYGLTKFGSTTVVVTNQALASDQAARTLALASDVPRIPTPTVPAPTPEVRHAGLVPRIIPIPLDLFPLRRIEGGQTIQLTAAPSPVQAEAHWNRLVANHPELSGYPMTVIPAVVGAQRVYRLRTTAPGAHALCASLKRAGEACFNVN